MLKHSYAYILPAQTLAHLYIMYKRHLWLHLVRRSKKQGKKMQLSHPIYFAYTHSQPRFPSSLTTFAANRLAEPIFRRETRKTACWSEDAHISVRTLRQRPSCRCVGVCFCTNVVAGVLWQLHPCGAPVNWHLCSN